MIPGLRMTAIDLASGILSSEKGLTTLTLDEDEDLIFPEIMYNSNLTGVAPLIGEGVHLLPTVAPRTLLQLHASISDNNNNNNCPTDSWPRRLGGRSLRSQ